MVAIMGFLSLAVDLGNVRTVRRQLQNIADAAAVSGATELNVCAGTQDCGAMTTAAQDAVTENGLTGSTLVTQCGTTSGNLWVMVNNPPCYLGSKTKDPNYGNANYTEVVVSRTVPTYFAHLINVPTATVTARAEGTLPGGGSCIFATGSSGTELTLAVGGFISQCGVVDESKSTGLFSPAFLCLLGVFDAPYIGVVGTADWLACNNGGGQNPTQGIAVPSPADPLAYLQPDLASEAPGPGSCGSGSGKTWAGSPSQLTISSSGYTLSPGTYCGGINIAPGANVTMNSGIYTLTSTSGSNGGLSIDAGTTVNGNGVGFYNYGPNGGVNFLFSSATLGHVTLTAPNSTNCSACGQAWQGILFYQAPTDHATSVVVGSASWNTKLTGTSYFPDANVTYALDLQVNYNDVVAQSVTMGLAITVNGNTTDVGSNFYNNYAELTNGNPVKSTIAVLAE
jgi:Flp pilus assembly protein TadG